jgi:hypothetical protein
MLEPRFVRGSQYCVESLTFMEVLFIRDHCGSTKSLQVIVNNIILEGISLFEVTPIMIFISYTMVHYACTKSPEFNHQLVYLISQTFSHEQVIIPHLYRLAPQDGYGHSVGIENISADGQLKIHPLIRKVIDSTSHSSHRKTDVAGFYERFRQVGFEIDQRGIEQIAMSDYPVTSNVPTLRFVPVDLPL